MLALDELSKMSEEEVKQHIIDAYEADPDLVNKFEILIADEGYGSYEGNSYFLLRDKETGKLFENSAGHCSCMGFEGQFVPSETSLVYLKSEHYPYRTNERFKAIISLLE